MGEATRNNPPGRESVPDKLFVKYKKKFRTLLY